MIKDIYHTQVLLSKVSGHKNTGINTDKTVCILVRVEKVRNAFFAKGRIVRDGVLNIPDRVSSLLANIDDAAKIHEILSQELRTVLEELSNDDLC